MIKAEAILPRAFKPDVFMKNFEKAGREWLEGVDRNFNRSHADWSKKNVPKHKKKVRVSRNKIEATVEIQGKIYAIVHQGSPAHKIRPKGDYKLKFQKGYKAKTVPGYFASFPGGPFGPVVSAKEVDHPGFPGRFQSKAIKAQQEKPFFNEMEEALHKSVKECGHAL